MLPELDGDDRYRAIASELLRSAPTDFVKARSRAVAQARADGDQQLAGRLRTLRKPTTAAYAINLYAHENAPRLAEFIELGRQARDKHLALTPAALREISDLRSTLVATLSAAVRDGAVAAGVPVGPTARDDIVTTLLAVLANDEAAQVAAAGLLLTPLQYSGLGFDGEVTNAGAGRTSAGARQRGTGTAPPRRTDDLGAAAARRRARADAQRAMDAAAEQLRAAEEEATQRGTELDAARLRVASAERDLRAATDAEQEAESAVRRATTQVATARERLLAAEREAHERR